jgi:hypothetical protein
MQQAKKLLTLMLVRKLKLNLLKFGPGYLVLQLSNFYGLYNIVQYCTNAKKIYAHLLMTQN